MNSIKFLSLIAVIFAFTACNPEHEVVKTVDVPEDAAVNQVESKIALKDCTPMTTLEASFMKKIKNHKTTTITFVDKLQCSNDNSKQYKVDEPIKSISSELIGYTTSWNSPKDDIVFVEISNLSSCHKMTPLLTENLLDIPLTMANLPHAFQVKSGENHFQITPIELVCEKSDPSQEEPNCIEKKRKDLSVVLTVFVNAKVDNSEAKNCNP